MKPVTSTNWNLADPPMTYESLPSQVVAGAPIQLSISVLPAHASNQLVVEIRLNGRNQAPVRGWPEKTHPGTGAQSFRVGLPPLAADDTAEYCPIVKRAGLEVQRFPCRSTRAVPEPATTVAAESSLISATAVPRYQWATEFLGAFTVQLTNPPVSFGPGPDGLRITYYIESGEIRGPKLNGKIQGGDWMVLRQDGVGIAESRITYETDDGALLLSRYSGIFDLGVDGYERALKNEFDPVPPLVLTPTFTTSHPNWLWLNRLQCLAVGRATMADLVVRLDIYAVRTGQPLTTSGLAHVDAPALVGDIH